MAYTYFTFHSTADSMAADSLLKKDTANGRLVLTPRELTAGCGMAWRTTSDKADDIEQMLEEHHIAIQNRATL